MSNKSQFGARELARDISKDADRILKDLNRVAQSAKDRFGPSKIIKRNAVHLTANAFVAGIGVGAMLVFLNNNNKGE
ncbi:hypothetical protein GW915_06380 [bacterium]|nr:hypothetical protein [bacterium]